MLFNQIRLFHGLQTPLKDEKEIHTLKDTFPGLNLSLPTHPDFKHLTFSVIDPQEDVFFPP